MIVAGNLRFWAISSGGLTMLIKPVSKKNAKAVINDENG